MGRGTSSASDLLLAGWLPPNAAADRLGITVQKLRIMAKNREIRSRAISPGRFLYEVKE